MEKLKNVVINADLFMVLYQEQVSKKKCELHLIVSNKEYSMLRKVIVELYDKCKLWLQVNGYLYKLKGIYTNVFDKEFCITENALEGPFSARSTTFGYERTHYKDYTVYSCMRLYESFDEPFIFIEGYSLK